MANNSILVAIGAIVLLFLLQQLLNLKKKLKLPPGPIGLPILGHLHLLGTEPHKYLARLAQKHGSIMSLRFGFVPTIIISSPEAAELVLKTHDLIFANRPHFSAEKYLGYDQKSIIFGRYGPYWRNIRKLYTLKLLSNLRINQFLQIRKTELDLFISSLKGSAEKCEIVDLSAKSCSLTADIICLMVFGKKYVDEDMGEKGFKDVMTETLEIAGRVNLGDFFPYIEKLDLQGLRGRMERLKISFDGFFEKIIDDHVENKTEERQQQDFVETMMAMMESGEVGIEFDRNSVKATLLDMFVAGTDTSATSIEWIMSELIRNPIAMLKLQKELESVVGMEHMVEESHLGQLKYLDCVVKETFRLHPNLPLLVPHESMEDSLLQEFQIPKNSRVLVNVWAIGRDPNVWSDPETFSPDRFIGSNIDVRGKDFQLLPFGTGRRGCPGIQLALLVLRLVVAQLVHCFDWKLSNDMKPNELDMSEQFGLVTGRKNHLTAIPTFRLHK